MRGFGRDQTGEPKFTRRADQLRCVGRRNTGQYQQIGVGTDHRGQNRGKVGGVDLIGDAARDNLQPQGLSSSNTTVTLAEQIAFVGRDKGDSLNAVVFHQVLIDRRP